MGSIGTVLSVAGTIFLVLLKGLALLLFILLLLFLLPITYKVQGEYKEELSFQAVVTFPLGVLRGRIQRKEGEMEYSIRIAGISWETISKWFSRRKKKPAGKKREEKPSQTKFQNSREVHKETEKPKKEETVAKTTDLEIAQKDTTWKEKKRDKIKMIVTFFSSLWKLIKKWIKGVKDKVQWAKEWKAFWQKDSTRQMVCILKENVVHLWRKIRPKRMKGYVSFGTGDPCTTGEILGVAAMFYAYYGGKVSVIPDFEQAKFEASLGIKGGISLFTIMGIVIRIYLAKEWKEFSQDIEHLKEAL